MTSMNTTLRKMVFASVVVCALCVRRSSGELLYSQDFESLSTGGLSGQDSFTAMAAAQVASGDLAYNSGAVTVDGGRQCVTFSGLTPANNWVFSHEFTEQTGAVYFSLLMTWTNQQQDDMFYFALSDDTDTTPCALGNSAGVNINQNGKFFARSRGNSSNDTTSADTNKNGGQTTASAQFVVGCVSKSGSGNYDTLRLWVNPTSYTQGQPDTTVSRDIGIAALDTFYCFSGSSNESDETMRVDNIRVGTTWEDVLPTPASPDPPSGDEPTPAIQFDVGLTGSTSNTQKGPAHVANGGVLSNAATIWNAVGAAAEYNAVSDVAPGTLVSATGVVLPTVGIDFGQDVNNNTDTWKPDYANHPMIRNPGQNGVYNNAVMKDMLCFNGGNHNTSFMRVYGLNPGRYAVYSMHRNGYQGYTISQTARIVAGDSTTDLSSAPSTTLTYTKDADTASWLQGKNFAFALVEVTAAAPDIIIAANSTQNNQRGVINAVQIVPMPLEVSIAATDTTHYANTEWRVPCTIRFDATCEGATTYVWNWGEDSTQSETTSSATATHSYTDPGTYSVRLVATDADGNAGIATVTLTLSGNANPKANAGTPKAGLVGSALTLDATASSDPDAGDTLSYAWTQLDGPTVALSDATSATPSYTPSAAGTYVFQVTVSDGGDPVRTDTASVTNYVHARFKSAVMIDFGANGNNASAAQKVNTPAHSAEMLGSSDNTWFQWRPSAGDNGTPGSALSGAVDSRGNPVGLTIDLGNNTSLVPNYAAEPFQRGGNGNGGGGVGVFAGPIFCDFLQANNNGITFVRLAGFEPGSYRVFLTARNTFQGGTYQVHYLRAGAGDASTQLVDGNAPWTDADKTGYTTDAEMRLTEWVEGVNYRSQVVELTAEAPDLLVVSQRFNSNSDAKYGVINTVQVVPMLLSAQFVSTADSGARAPLTVSFDASGSVGSGLTYIWNWGDGSPEETLSTATATHAYDLPGSYPVVLTIRDGNGQSGSVSKTLVLTGNHVPVADAGEIQNVLLSSGLVVSLDASGSTDSDAGDTLSYAWTQISGPQTQLYQANTATPYYRPTEAGEYVFQVTVTDDGSPARSSTATVTNFVKARFRSAVMVDFGADTLAASAVQLTNSPAHAEGVLDGRDTTWINWKPSAGDNGTLPDLMDGAKDSRNRDIGLSIDLGSGTGVPNYAAQPYQRTGNRGTADRSGLGVFNSPVFCDFLQVNGNGNRSFLRLSGFDTGTYRVYIVARNTFQKDNPDHEHYRLRAVAGNASTAPVSDAAPWTSEDVTGYDTQEERALTEWVEGLNYRVQTIRLTAETPDVIVVSQYLDANRDQKDGVVNAVQVVPVGDPATLIFLF